MRTGKTLPAKLWAKKRKHVIVICPKQLLKEWEGTGTVYSKEQFKKSWKDIKEADAVIVDEAHTFGSALFTRSRSALSTALYRFMQAFPDIDVLLLTATPIRNDPSSLHSLLCYMGIVIPWKKWRDHFYSLEYRPFLKRPAYFPKKDWRVRIRPVLEKHADIVSLADCVSYLPPVTTEVVPIKTPPFVRSEGQILTWTDIHQHEQANKGAFIRTLGYRKILIACQYTAQIDALAEELSKDRETFVLDGRTKHPSEVIRAAQEADECYFIVQSSMGIGFDGWMFGATVYASLSHRSVDHTQMYGRLRHLKHLKPLVVYYLIGGIWDKRVYDAIMKNKDFNPHIYKNELA